MNYHDRHLDLSTVLLIIDAIISVTQQARKFVLLDKKLKGKTVLQLSLQYQDSSQF